MSYDNEVREDLAKINKNNRGEFIHVTKITNKTNSNVSVDVRQYYTSEGGEILPTKKGIRLNSELALEVISEMIKVLENDELEDLKDNIDSLLGDEDDDCLEDEGEEDDDLYTDEDEQ
jgi:hypothetical protein